ncbi:hypothetical protein Tco_1164283 [Tanacetum coccineum]
MSIVPNEEEAINYEVLDKRYQIVDWKSEFYHDDRYGEPHDYYRVFRVDGSSRYIKTFTQMVSRLVLLVEDFAAAEVLKNLLQVVSAVRVNINTVFVTEQVVFKAPKPSSNAERVPQGTKPGAKPGNKKHSTSSSKDATNCRSSKAPTGSKTDHSKKRKESSSAMDSNPHQPPGLDEGTKNTSFDRISIGTDPHVLVDQTQYVSEGLETILTQPTTGKGTSSIARQVKEEESSRTIKLEDLAKLVSNV